MPSPIRFPEVRKLLEQHGWALTRIAGSHHIFEKAGDRLWSIPVHRGKVKAVYVRQIKKHVGEA
jgi:predicted RNA binding protein YcfA (HicA-like mRNA interferase family)